MPTGFVFVWADKENIPQIIETFESKGFYYVENLVWVQCHDEDMAALHEVDEETVSHVDDANTAASEQADTSLPSERKTRCKWNGDVRLHRHASPASSGRDHRSVQHAQR